MKDDHTINYGSYKLTLLHDDSALIIKDNPMAVAVDARFADLSFNCP